jgi:hypothetical protein
MKILFSAVFALSCWLVLPPAAVACSCAGPSDPCLALTTADVVFVGRAAAIQPGALELPNLRPAMVRFEVAEVLHGTVPKVIELRQGDGASCIFRFAPGREYLVYARYREGALEAFLCSRTGELAERRHDVDILRERRRGTPVPRLAGRITEERQRVDGTLGGELLPLVGVTVTAKGGTGVRRTVSDADGRFLFMNIPLGDYKLTADLPRAYEHVLGQNATVTVGCYGEVNIGVYRVPLRGTLATAEGKPESMPITVHAFAIDRSQRRASKERSTFTYLARDGTWSFDRLPPGEYLIGVGVYFKTPWDPVRIPFWYPAASRPEEAEIVRIGESGVVQLALRHPPPPPEIQFSGVIVDQSGTPTNGGGVWLHDLDVDQNVANGPADASGRFQVRGWKHRRYSITAYNCNGRVPAMSAPVPIDPQSTEPLRVVLMLPCPGRAP